jgi:RHS repeat-associated protein
VASTTDFNGSTIRYEYDANNQLTAERYPDGTSVVFTYTSTGQRATATNTAGTTTYQYDARNQLVAQTGPDGRTVGYANDLAGNETSVTAPSGTVRFSYDVLNRLETVTDPDMGVTRYSYDAVGDLVRTDLPNGIVETRGYDELNRLTTLEDRGPGGVVSSYHYTLGPTGLRAAVQEDSGRHVDYTYDALGHLTQEAIADPAAGPRTSAYTYDAVSNRLSRSDSVEGTTLYAYDDNDRLLSETLAGAVTRYTYDSNGNTLSRVRSTTDQVVSTWDFENRLVGEDITDPSGTRRLAFRYDTAGNRVATVSGGQETRYLVDTNRPFAQVIEEYTPGGILQASYVGGLALISQSRAGQHSFYLADGLGSTRVLTDSGGRVTDRYVYDAFGILLGHTGSAANPFLFTGQQFDDAGNQYYLRARWYDPATGRFSGRDSFAGIPSSPVTRHSYLYAGGNPVNATDPGGHGFIPSDRITGTLVHQKIGDDFQLRYEGREAEPFVNRALATILGLNPAQAVAAGLVESFDGPLYEVDTYKYLGNLRPDLARASRTMGEVWEIKPASSYIEGALQLAGYLALLRWADPLRNADPDPLQWRQWQTGGPGGGFAPAGTNYYPPPSFMVYADTIAFVQIPLEGVILYQLYKLDDNEIRQRASDAQAFDIFSPTSVWMLAVASGVAASNVSLYLQAAGTIARGTQAVSAISQEVGAGEIAAAEAEASTGVVL